MSKVLEFKTGDELIVVNAEPLKGNEVGPPLKLDQMVKVKSVHICGCGSRHLDVGLKSEYNYIRCYECQEELPKEGDIHWCHQTRFKLK